MIWVNCAFALRQEIVQLIRAKLRDCSSLEGSQRLASHCGAC